MKVKDCMSSGIVSVSPTETITNVAKQMQQNHIGCITVCDNNNKLVGLITDRDLILRCIASGKNCEDVPVSDIMTTNIYSVSPDDTVDKATTYMSQYQIRRLPVVQDGALMGMLTIADISVNPDVSTNKVGEMMEGICGCHRNNNAE